jgi:glutamate dehydrogenase/leucine dehydrogenase
MEEINSQMIYTVNSKKFGKIGYVVIDRLVDTISSFSSFGGVRVVPEMNIFELQSIARTMTYKNAFIGNRTGGAKAAVIVSKDNKREEILSEFGKNISRLIFNRMYFPVMDMGIDINELQLIFDSAGYKCDCLSWENMSHEYTAYSCFYSTMAVLESKGISIKDVTFSVQGFGNVGSTYALLMFKEGARLTALSNIYGGIADENGFNVEELLKEKLLYGDNFILTKLKEKGTSYDSVLEKDVTVLLPASNALVINNGNMKNIKADIIICAANAPVSYDAEKLLFNEKKTIITDFVANCGGILGSANVNKETILRILSTDYKKKVSNILTKSIDLKRPFIDIAMGEVEDRIDRDYEDVIISRGKTEYIADLISNLPMNKTTNKIINNVLSKRYSTRYKTLWG